MRYTLLRARKVWAGLHGPLSFRALRRGVGASLEHGEALAGRDFDTIVDVGANRGQFAVFARTSFPTARIISFEPLPGPAAVFEDVFRGDPKTRLVRAAIASKRGQLTMQVTGPDDSSSPLEVGERQIKTFGTVVVERRDVACGLLSDFIADEEIGKANLLKIDTQGFELEVLKGADDILGRFQVIYCEVSFVELYVGQALASEVIAYLYDRSFGLAGVFNLELSLDTGPVQADMLFVQA